MPTQRSIDFALAEATSRERFALVLSAWEALKEASPPPPMVRTVARQLLGWIHDAGGDAGLVRTVREFASRFDCSPATVRRALDALASGGLIQREERFRETGDQAANAYRIRWACVAELAAARNCATAARLAERARVLAGAGGLSDGEGGLSDGEAPRSAESGPLLSAERPLPTSPSTSFPTAPLAPEAGDAAAAAEEAREREWEAARAELREAGLTAPKASDAIRKAKRDGYSPEEVRLLVGILRDELAKGRIRSPGAIVARLASPPGSPPLEGWPVDLNPPRPRPAGAASSNSPELLFERKRLGLIDHLQRLGLARPAAVAEADRRLAASTTHATKGPRA